MVTDHAINGDREVSQRLHSAALRLLRGVRRIDHQTGLSAARLSALSVLVFAGPRSVSELASAEQVSLPTMSRLLKDMAHAGLLRRQAAPADARKRIFSATARGRKILDQGRRNRVAVLQLALDALSAEEKKAIAQALPALERLAVMSQEVVHSIQP